MTAIPKPGKDPSSQKATAQSRCVDEKLTKDHAGFRPGRSCAGQLLNVTHHIEDGYKRKMLTGATYVDLSAAYDIVQHRLMIRKLMDMTAD